MCKGTWLSYRYREKLKKSEYICTYGFDEFKQTFVEVYTGDWVKYFKEGLR